MPAIHNIDLNSKLLITVWEGDAVDKDMIEALEKYQETILCNSDYYDFNEVLDLTKVTAMKLTTDGLRKISSIASSTDINRIDAKLAIIVSSNIAYGLARIYVTFRSFSQNSSKVIRIFKNHDAALEWI